MAEETLAMGPEGPVDEPEVQPVLQPMVEMPPEEETEVMVLGQSEARSRLPRTLPPAALALSLPPRVALVPDHPKAPRGGEGAMVQHGVPSNFNRNE